MLTVLHQRIKNHTNRGGAVSAFARIAYRAGERLTDPQTGKIYDFTRKSEIADSGIELPQGAPQEWQDRAALWAAVQSVETRSNARFAREFELSIPAELSKEQAINLVKDFSGTLAAEGMCVDWAVHWKHSRGGTNHHAHIMTTTRALDEDGHFAKNKAKGHVFKNKQGYRMPICVKTGGKKTDADYYADAIKQADGSYKIPDGYEQAMIKRHKNGKEYKKASWKIVIDEQNPLEDLHSYERWRSSWADLVNVYLKDAGADRRITNKSYRRQGFNTQTATMPRAIAERARAGESRAQEIAAALNEKIRKSREYVETRAAAGAARWRSSCFVSPEKWASLDEARTMRKTAAEAYPSRHVSVQTLELEREHEEKRSADQQRERRESASRKSGDHARRGRVREVPDVRKCVMGASSDVRQHHAGEDLAPDVSVRSVPNNQLRIQPSDTAGDTEPRDLRHVREIRTDVEHAGLIGPKPFEPVQLYTPRSFEKGIIISDYAQGEAVREILKACDELGISVGITDTEPNGQPCRLFVPQSELQKAGHDFADRIASGLPDCNGYGGSLDAIDNVSGERLDSDGFLAAATPETEQEQDQQDQSETETAQQVRRRVRSI